MSSFARFGITHLSHSSLDTYRNSAGLWTLQYLHNIKDGKMYAAKRGNSVEHGFYLLACGQSLEFATIAATENYHQRVDGEMNDQIEKETKMIAPMLSLAHDWVKENRPEIAKYQINIRTMIPGIDDIEVDGWVDFGLLSGVDLDVKTTGRRPDRGEARPSHKRQLGVYHQKRGRPQQLLYITPREIIHAEVSPAELQAGWEETIDIAHQLEKWLARMPNKWAALECAHFDPDHNFVTPELRAARKQLLSDMA